MKLQCYAIYDNKAKAFVAPFFMINDAVAIRAFSNSANDPENMICKYPNDFCLYNVGCFDDDTAGLVSHPTAVNLGLAVDYQDLDAKQPSLFEEK